MSGRLIPRMGELLFQGWLIAQIMVLGACGSLAFLALGLAETLQERWKGAGREERGYVEES